MTTNNYDTAGEKITFENKITTPFTWVENNLIRSKSLSFQALGLYLVLRSFGKDSYPSIPYLCSIGKTTRDKMYKILDELIEAKLLLRKRSRNEKGHLSKTVYRILSINDDYGIVYKEFTGKEYVNFTASHPRPEIAYMDESLENSSSHPRPDNPDMDRAYQAETCKALKIEDLKAQKIRPIRTKEQEEEKESHTIEENIVCKGEIEKRKEIAGRIRDIGLFKHLNNEMLFNLTSEYGEEVVKAARYIEIEFKEIAVKNPAGLLIKTLRSGLYSEPEKIEEIKSNVDVENLNKQYDGTNFEDEKIAEIFNLAGRIAFRTNNLMRELIYTKAKNSQEFEEFLRQRINDTS